MSIAFFMVFCLIFAAAVSSEASEEGPTVIIVGSDEDEAQEKQTENEGEQPSEGDVRGEGESSVTIMEEAGKTGGNNQETYQEEETVRGDGERKPDEGEPGERGYEREHRE
jgi:hypothetical protein